MYSGPKCYEGGKKLERATENTEREIQLTVRNRGSCCNLVNDYGESIDVNQLERLCLKADGTIQHFWGHVAVGAVRGGEGRGGEGRGGEEGRGEREKNNHRYHIRTKHLNNPPPPQASPW